MKKLALFLAIVSGAALVHVSANGAPKNDGVTAQTEVGVVHARAR